MKSHPVYDPFPKYLQVREVLLRWMVDRQVGEMLPSEKALSHEFQVSRVTIREALKSLEEDGIIARRAGLGTWMARPAPTATDQRATGPIEEFIRLGMETSTTLLSTSLITAPAEVAAVFRQNADWAVLEVQRLRLVEGAPFLLLKAYFPPSIGKKVANISHSDTLYIPTLRALHDREIREEWQRIEAIAVESQVAKILKIKSGSPALVVNRLFIDSHRKPVVYFVTIYRADRYYYTVKLPQSKNAPTHARKRSVRPGKPRDAKED